MIDREEVVERRVEPDPLARPVGSYDEVMTRRAEPAAAVASERVETIATDPYDRSRDSALRLQQGIYLVFGIIEGLIAIRFVLRLLGANPAGRLRLVYLRRHRAVRGALRRPVWHPELRWLGARAALDHGDRRVRAARLGPGENRPTHDGRLPYGGPHPGQPRGHRDPLVRHPRSTWARSCLRRLRAQLSGGCGRATDSPRSTIASRSSGRPRCATIRSTAGRGSRNSSLWLTYSTEKLGCALRPLFHHLKVLLKERRQPGIVSRIGRTPRSAEHLLLRGQNLPMLRSTKITW